MSLKSFVNHKKAYTNIYREGEGKKKGDREPTK